MFYYLANPYGHKDKTIEDKRVKQITEVAGSLIRYGIANNTKINILSPVIHNSHINKVNNFNRDERMYVFMNFDFDMLARAGAMIVIMLDGWKESMGVTKEIEFCKENNIPIHYFTFDEIINKSEKLKTLI